VKRPHENQEFTNLKSESINKRERRGGIQGKVIKISKEGIEEGVRKVLKRVKIRALTAAFDIRKGGPILAFCKETAGQSRKTLTGGTQRWSFEGGRKSEKGLPKENKTEKPLEKGGTTTLQNLSEREPNIGAGDPESGKRSESQSALGSAGKTEKVRTNRRKGLGGEEEEIEFTGKDLKTQKNQEEFLGEERCRVNSARQY